MRWNGEVGPAAVIGVLGSLSVLVSVGVVWGSTTSRIDAAATKAAEAKTAVEEVNRESVKRDQRAGLQNERLGKIETSIQFIVPALQRIESKLDATARP